MDKKKIPKEGDRCVGVITLVKDGGPYWILKSPSFSNYIQDDAVLGHVQQAFFYKKEKPNTKFYENQIVMFEYRPWPTDRNYYFWQPLPDYFETNRPE